MKGVFVNPSNQLTVIGNVGDAPAEKTKTRGGKSVVSFAIAQNTSGIDPATGARVQKEPQWFRVTCFGGLGDRVLANIKKGDLLLVSGELRSRSYVDKTGAKRTATEIVAAEALKVERLRRPQGEKEPGDASADGGDFDHWDGEEGAE